jgi:Zn-dependent protease
MFLLSIDGWFWPWEGVIRPPKKLLRGPENLGGAARIKKVQMDSNWMPGPYSTPAPVPAPPGSAYQPAEPSRPSPSPRSRAAGLKGRIGAALAALAALLAKFKTVLLLLPKLKLFTSAGTMLVSLAAYSFVFGWEFAAGFVALLFVHEMGHVIALRREGIKATAPMFIPFLGAVISARSLGDDASAEARVGLAGPILGSVAAAACAVIWQLTGSDLWRALAFTGFFLNLFNLLPVLPLDGGRAMAAMAPWMWFVGFAAMVPLAILFPNPIILLILVFAGYETYKRWKLRRSGSPAQQTYYRVSKRNRALVASVYIGLIGLLILGMHATLLQRSFS